MRHPSAFFLALIGFGLFTCAYSLEYDYIIVGGGTAGSVLANRLSEDPTVTVALIEAGGSVLDNPSVTSIYGWCLGCNSPIDWNYTSIPQVYSNNQILDYPSGKCLGGTSAINGLVYLRPAEPELGSWQAVGNPDWSWTNIFPYFRKSEHLQIPPEMDRADGASYIPSAHGFDGPLDVGWSPNLDPGQYGTVLNSSWQSLGLKWNIDPNAGSPSGLFLHPSAFNLQLGGIREDAARAYYWPVSNRSNLFTLANTTVSRVILNKGTGYKGKVIATGVELTSLISGEVVHARREVILSTGTYRTPGLLEVSGIGNPRILANLSVPVNVHLPGVGIHTQDQPRNILVFNSTGISDNTNTFTDVPTFAYVTAKDVCGSDLSHIAAETRRKIPQYAKIRADSSNGGSTIEAETRLLTIRADLIFDQNAPIGELVMGASYAAIFTTLPLSVGTVHASQNEPDKPLINPNFYQIDFDLRVQAALARLARKLYDTPPLSATIISEISPGLSLLPASATDEQWASWLRSSADTSWHGTSSAGMMSRSLGGVLDDQMVVYGTENLRVVDASAIPFEVNGHPTSTIYAIAEKASDMIKERWAGKYGGSRLWRGYGR